MARSFVETLRHKYYVTFKVLVFVLATMLVVFFIPREGKFRYEIQKGKPWQQESLFAPFDFAIAKPDDQLLEERSQALKSVNPYFLLNREETARGREALKADFSRAWAGKYGDQKPGIKKASMAVMLAVFDTIHQVGIMSVHKAVEDRESTALVNVVKDRVAQSVPLASLFKVKSAFDYASMVVSDKKNIDKELVINTLGDHFVQNLDYSEQMTHQDNERALASVSVTYGMVQQGELIIAEGEVIDNNKFNVLNSLRREYETRVGIQSSRYSLLGGHFILTGAIFAILFLFIMFIRPDVFEELKKINLILLLMLFIIIPAFVIISAMPALLYFIPFGILPIIMITFFDTRLTLMVHLLSVVIIALVVPNAYEFVFFQFVVGFVVIFSLVNHNKRLFFFRTSVFIFLAYTVVYFGFLLIQEGSLKMISINQIWAFLFSSSLTLLALPLIYLFERMFGMITDLTLLELSNTNSPLLRELASKAPGTFQHSMQVANLSEEALYEIGGDTLLARTGALYHDIGKMDNPLYFIENQLSGYNPHNDITYAESASIIVGHVIKGIEKARKARLPEQVIDFIRTHHGNRRVEYFYVMEQRQNPGFQPDEREFSYRGPIPFSKETAVVMMADSVEAASRSLKVASEQKINDLVENIIGKQMETNQFINANITLKEIFVVKKILKKKLMNIYHVRIAYPE
ncbi:MAG: HDIG domain-containing protein [Bacteroidales bacterium]|nr:HDIG domain-containing protein [Bacteroidales bacterium]